MGFECGSVEIGLTTKPKDEISVVLTSSSMEVLMDNVSKTYKALKETNWLNLLENCMMNLMSGQQATFGDYTDKLREILLCFSWMRKET